MLSKSELKKRLIIKKSREVFMQKGYKMVTMTDIVKACEISRGGLYRYYNNTAEIFLEMLDNDQVDTGCFLMDLIEDGLSAVFILDSFFLEQKEELLKKDKSLMFAIYEFFSIHKNNLKQDRMKEKFESAVEILSKVIQYGIDRGEFNFVDKDIIATNIVLFLEGMRISSQVMTMTEDLIDEQFNYFKETIFYKGG